MAVKINDNYYRVYNFGKKSQEFFLKNIKLNWHPNVDSSLINKKFILDGFKNGAVWTVQIIENELVFIKFFRKLNIICSVPFSAIEIVPEEYQKDEEMANNYLSDYALKLLCSVFSIIGADERSFSYALDGFN